MEEFKIEKTLYYQGKKLHLAKLRFCRALYDEFFEPVLRAINRLFETGRDAGRVQDGKRRKIGLKSV